MTHTIKVARQDDDIAVVTLARPEKRNAMDRASQRALLAALDDLTDMKVVVITGSENSFCSGVDIKERREQTDADFSRLYARGENDWVAVNVAVRHHSAVMIAAVNGFALGGGLTLVHSSDLAIAGESATFGMPEVTFGAVPAYAGPATRLRISSKAAAYLAFTGQPIDAAEAARVGVVNRVVPDADLMSEALELARTVAAFDVQALRLTKSLLRDTEGVSWQGRLDHGGLIGALCRVAKG